MARANPLLNMARRGTWSRRAVLQALGLAMAGGSMILGGCSNQEAKTHTVEMISEGGEEIFNPDRLHIQPGDTVSWVLISGFHSTTAYHPDHSDHPLRIPENAIPWDSGLVRSDGQRFDMTFEHEGVYCYYCTPHEALGMIGMVVVGNVQTAEPGLLMPQNHLAKGAKEKLTELIEWANQL